MAKWLYKGFIVSIHGGVILTNLVDLEMIDFDVIMRLDWLYSCYTKLDCRSKIVRFEFSNELVIERKRNITMLIGRFISYPKGQI